MAADDDTTTQQVTLPQLGESVDSGIIIAWLVGPGDDIEVDQPIAEISTDKVDTEIPSPVAGTVVRQLAEVDAEVAVGQPILEVSGGGDGGAPADQGGPGPTDPPGDAVAAGTGSTAPSEASRTDAPAEDADTTDATAGRPDATADRPDADRSDAAADGATGAAAAPRDATDGSGAQPGPGDRLSPRVRRLLGDHGLDPADVRGTGSGGRITPDDVVRTAGGRDTSSWRGLRLSPLVKRLLREHAIDPHDLDGTGSDGRITPDDVRTAAGAAERPARQPEPEPQQPAAARPGGAGEPEAPAPAASAEAGGAEAGTAQADTAQADTAAAGAPAAAGQRAAPPAGDERRTVEPLSRTRKVIAERMLASLQTTAQLTAAVEADMTRIMLLRARIRDTAKARYGFAPSPLAFAAKATCRALQRHPIINASIDTDAGTVTYHRPVNLGIAVDTPNGLMVPVIRDAHELGVLALQERINDLAARARSRELRPDDMHGGTFTITNTGSGGTLFDTPILNPPEAAILATPTIEKRPVVITDDTGNDQLAIRHRTYLCLSYDHRLIDGADAARFLTDLASQLDETDWEQELAELTA